MMMDASQPDEITEVTELYALDEPYGFSTISQ